MIRATINEEQLMIDDYSVGQPTLYSNLVTIPGRNGVLDYSKAITGNPTYFNRTISIRFSIIGDGTSRDMIFNDFYNRYYGQSVKVAFSNLEGYFKGKITSITRTTSLLRSSVIITVDCYPFRTLDDGSEVL